MLHFIGRPAPPTTKTLLARSSPVEQIQLSEKVKVSRLAAVLVATEGDREKYVRQYRWVDPNVQEVRLNLARAACKGCRRRHNRAAAVAAQVVMVMVVVQVSAAVAEVVALVVVAVETYPLLCWMPQKRGEKWQTQK